MRDIAVKVRVSAPAERSVKEAAILAGMSMSALLDALFRALSPEAMAQLVREQRAVDAEERDRCSRPPK